MTYEVALVTGASSGIGRATAVALAKQGVRLVLLARRRERLEELSEELSSMVPCWVIEADVTDFETLKRSIADLPKDFAEIDLLINNAGLALGVEPAHEVELENWEQMIATNCLALARLTNLLLPHMVARNRGHIINIGSVAGTYAYPGGNVYCASKAFVNHFSLNLKTDLLGTQVRVTNIEPGMVGGAEFSLVRYKGDEQKSGAVYEGCTPLSPDDIAETITWAISRPAHVNINRLEVMPVCQAPGGFAVHRDESS